MKPLVKWYGGKTNMIKHLLPLLIPHRTYVEPFAGGAALFFAKKPAKLNVLNDKMELLVNLYKQVKLHPDKFYEMCMSMPYAKSEHEKTRKLIYDPNSDLLERAVAFWYQSQASFSHMPGSTFSRDGSKNIKGNPFVFANGKKEMLEKIQLLDCVQIEEDDAIRCITRYDHESAFFFIDPPYVGADQGHYAGYTQDDFNRLLDTLSGIRGKFLMTCYPNERLSELTETNKWNKKEIQMIGAFRIEPGKKGQKIEVLTMNYSVENPVISENLF